MGPMMRIPYDARSMDRRLTQSPLKRSC